MPIEFRCSQCDQLLRVPEGNEGRSARCPRCQALVRVPDQAGAALPPPGGLEPALSQPAGDPGSSPGAREPAPPAAPSDNPFREETGTSPFRSAPAAQPFGPAETSLNPYATPVVGGYEPAYGSGAARTGLPWEVRGASFGSWWETAWLCITTPAVAFQRMRQYGGLGSPMLFAVCGMLIGQLGQLVWQLPLVVVPVMIEGNNNGAHALGLAEVALQLVAGVVGTLVGASVGLLIAAALHHLVLVLAGGPLQGYETTYRVVAFVNGSIAMLNVIPCLGPFLGLLLYVACMIIGLSQAHETTTGKAALAVLAPFLICLALCLASLGTIVYTSVGVQAVLLGP